MGACICQRFEANDFSILSHKPIDKFDFSLDESTYPSVSSESDRWNSVRLESWNAVQIEKSHFVKTLSGRVDEYYYLTAELGSGSYGTVYRAVHKQSGTVRAIKVTNKSFHAEVDILRTLDHPNILKIHEVIQNNEEIAIVTEICQGGRLFDTISAASLTQGTIKSIMRELLASVAYCHAQGIVHRDIKPENILIEGKSIKLIDFGIATHFVATHPLSRSIGTLNYMAPEVIRGSYNEKCDIWSCGVVLYLLITRSLPFTGEFEEEVIRKIQHAAPSFEQPVWGKVSCQLKELVSMMLCKDPKKRPSALEILKHLGGKQDLKTNFALLIKNLAEFNCQNKVRTAVLNYLAYNFARNTEVEHIRKRFLELDTLAEGKIKAVDIEKWDPLFIVDHDLSFNQFLTVSLDWKRILNVAKVESIFYSIARNGVVRHCDLKEFLGGFNQNLVPKEGIDLQEFKRIMSN